MQAQGLQKPSSARTLAHLMTVARHQLTRTDTVTVAAVKAGVPCLADARSLVEQFRSMIRKNVVAEMGSWIEQARTSLSAPLA